MSGVTLTSESSADVVTSALRRPLGDILPAPPTASREFPSGDRLTLYVEVYDNRGGRTTPPLKVRAELRADDGRVVKAVEQERSSADLQATTGVFAFLADVPLDVAPGPYVIHVEARPITADKPTVRRAIPIKVK